MEKLTVKGNLPIQRGYETLANRAEGAQNQAPGETIQEERTVTMTIAESIMYFLGTAAAVFIAVIFFDKLRGWFWDWYEGLNQKRRRD